MQFQVPQNIDVEDKIFGPFTWKQFVFIAGGAGLSFIVFRLIPFLFISGPLILGIMGFAWALGFYPKQKLGRPFTEIILSAIKYSAREKLYTWKRSPKDTPLTRTVEKEDTSYQTLSIPSISNSKLSELSWNVDVKNEDK